MLNKIGEEAAQGETEYALLLAAMALALIMILTYFGLSLVDSYQWVISQLPI